MNKEYIAHIREEDGQSQSLSQHLLETSSLTEQFAAKIGLGQQGKIVGLLHDLGKASNEFLRYIRSATGLINSDEDQYVDPTTNKGKIDHSSAGAQMIHEFFKGKSNDTLLSSQLLSLVIASHHSGLIDCLDPSGNDIFEKRMNKLEEKTHLRECEANLGEVIGHAVWEILASDTVVESLNQKVRSLKKKTDSRETYWFKVGLLTRYLFSCLIDADRINTADFEFPKQSNTRNLKGFENWNALIERLDSYLRKLEEFSSGKTEVEKRIDAIRQKVSDSCFNFSAKPKGIYKLSVPTGGGKTLSSLRFALKHAQIHGMDRIVYVIPYTSIIDQNAGKAIDILENNDKNGLKPENIVLEHHSNLTPEEETSRQKLLAENWDAPIIYTTMVKFLDTIYGHGTRDARRMHNLANSVVIFDEVQTLPVKCVQIFNVAVQFLVDDCGSTAVLCTATQPLLDKIEPIQRALHIDPEHEMIPDLGQLFSELRRVIFFDKRKAGGWREEEIAALVKEELESSGSVLVVVNTKKGALRLFQQLISQTYGAVYHLSTNMCPEHRMEVLRGMKSRLEEGGRVVCVSTQLIEAGIDIDFGSVIRYLAGLDSLAQAAGRCNRNGSRASLGRFFVINPKDENLSNLKSISTGRDIAQRVLNDFKRDPKQFDEDVLGPKAIETYYTYFFYDKKDEMPYKIHRGSLVNREDTLFNLLSTNSISLQEYNRINNSSPNIQLRQSFMTASNAFNVIDSNVHGVIVPYRAGAGIIEKLCGAPSLETEYRLIKAAQRYSIDLFDYEFQNLRAQGVIHEIRDRAEIFYIESSYYDQDHGFSGEPTSDMPFYNA
ncbi:MAG: CRISPR-associated helicase Cas3' [Candidatus Thermoplasmatota archaeon]|jgi:CRISPR-associated endonuclease/helicase Cas3|nr:CRISPR-associated helicase Cas3' [Candidatus Thermoplasmatota archaeon]MCL5785795.1 CRISPR-associated helicase Cas3' [Candidatus Thermoplasmatota archaeon]